MKKIILMSTMLIAAFALGACGEAKSSSEKSDIAVEKTGMPIVKETLKMSMMAPGAGLAEWDDMGSIQALEEVTGIDFDYTTPPQTDFSAKLNLAFASDELPDVIFGAGSALSNSMQVEYGSQGILLPLEDLIEDYAPNIKKYLDENPDFRKSITAPDGHIYSLARLYPEETVSPLYLSPLWYNGEWLKNLNITELPTNVDELYDLLLRFKNEDPNGNGKQDEIPLSDGYKNWVIRTWLLPAFGMKSQTIEEVNGKVRYAAASDNYLEYLTYMNKLYSEGLLDQEIFSQSSDQYQGNTETDKVGLFASQYSYMATGKSPSDAITDPMFELVTSDVQSTPLAPGHPRVVAGVFSITHKCKSPEAAMRWADYLYTDEGDSLLTTGPEGDWWEYQTNSDGEKVRVYVGDDTSKMEEDRGKVSASYGLNVPGIAADNPKDSVRANADDPAISAWDEFNQNEIKEKVMPYAEVPFPSLYLTPEEADKVAASATDISTYIEQMEAKFITGVEPLSNWDTYISKLKSMGLDEYVQVYQDAYDRWAES
jgi:putative aldouronate transport system substrate-binding protein